MDWTSVDLEKLANAILILIVGLGGIFGLNQARKSSPKSPGTETVEIAGALINGKDAHMLADTFREASDNFSLAASEMRALRLQLVDHGRIVQGNAEKADDVREATNNANTELRNLANALWANSRK